MSPVKPSHFFGIDVGIQRGCVVAVLNHRGKIVTSHWFSRGNEADSIGDWMLDLCPDGAGVVGIDAPRCPLPRPRKWFWRSDRWRARGPREAGRGRHCEVAIKALKLGNPQWSPLASDPIPEWMALGFALFDRLQPALETYEVFPTASYRQLHQAGTQSLEIDLSQCAPGPKDLLDACTAAETVRRLKLGRGSLVGGGDGLGTIALPGPTSPHPVLQWPAS